MWKNSSFIKGVKVFVCCGTCKKMWVHKSRLLRRGLLRSKPRN